LHPKSTVRTGGQIAWMIRKNTPKFHKVVNNFLKQHKKGTLIGNILFKRYLKNTQWVRNSLTEKELNKFRKTIDFFKKYASSYDFDWMMIMALAYQESGLDQSKRSSAGAIGVMQLLPDTATGHPIYIDNIEVLNNNIRAGVKYLRWIFDEFYKDIEGINLLNKVLFTFASYNAGPTRIVQLRNLTSKMGLDPNKWFNNVEVAAARKIGRETVQYVSNIYKYWVAYRLVLEQQEESLKK
jgi:membrane-bound lytic murein transglycosylase MltF